MATSGSTDYALTSRQIVAAALELCGLVQRGETPSNEDAARGLRDLNLMLKTWSTDPKVFILASGSEPFVAAQEAYSLPAARRVVEVRRRDSNNRDLPLGGLDRATYTMMPNKTQTGTPTSYFFDPQRSTRTLYVWPAPDSATAAGFTMEYTYQRVIEDSDSLNDDPDVPQEWLEAMTYTLAARLCVPDVITANPVLAAKIEERAAALYDQLSTQDQQGASVYLQPEPR